MTDTSHRADSIATDSVATLQRALQRISVRAPYFAFTAIEELGHGLVSASVPHELPAGAECGPFAAAQVARHLAILGSCAAALCREDDNRHHYLATSAHFTRTAGDAGSPPSGPFAATAAASWVDRRTARAFVQHIGPEGEGLYWLDTTYTVLTPRMFARLHPPVEPVALLKSAPSNLELGAVETTATGVRIDCGPIPTAVCAGHFDDYPAAPVAVVMGHLGAASARVLGSHLGHDISYRVEEARVKATKLGRAGQRLELEACYVRQLGSCHLIRGRATADGDTIGEMTVVLSVCGAL